MTEQDEAKEYVKQTMETARGIWGMETEKMRQQIETTASATWRVWRTELSPMTEPATKLRHREKP
jgi:polyhydroxyalkanoate synthesis regulator phasin